MIETDLSRYTSSNLNSAFLCNEITKLVKIAWKNNAYSKTISLVIEGNRTKFAFDYSGDGIVILKLRTKTPTLPVDITLVDFIKKWGPKNENEKLSIFKSILVALIDAKLTEPGQVYFKLNEDMYAFVAAISPSLIDNYIDFAADQYGIWLTNFLKNKLENNKKKQLSVV